MAPAGGGAARARLPGRPPAGPARAGGRRRRDSGRAVSALDLPAPFEIFVAPPGQPRDQAPRLQRGARPRPRRAAGHLRRGGPPGAGPAARGRRPLPRRPRPELPAGAAAHRPRPPLPPARSSPSSTPPSSRCMLPALQRLGAPFPLGGSSNHFRDVRPAATSAAGTPTTSPRTPTSASASPPRATAPACCATPTWSSRPRIRREWLRQRARWLKGHLQTWCVHMRRPRSAAGGAAGAAGDARAGPGLRLRARAAARPCCSARAEPRDRPAAQVARRVWTSLAAAGWAMSAPVMRPGPAAPACPARWVAARRAALLAAALAGGRPGAAPVVPPPVPLGQDRAPRRSGEGRGRRPRPLPSSGVAVADADQLGLQRRGPGVVLEQVEALRQARVAVAVEDVDRRADQGVAR